MSMSNHRNSGFSLIEIMIALTLGLVISGAIIQVMVSNSVTERLNRAMASAQEGGRFIMSRMRQELLMTGRYDLLSADLNRDVDVVDEANFVWNHPIPLPGDFDAAAAIGATQGAGGGNDTLVVSLLTNADCRGVTHGYDAAAGEEFYVVNQYFVEGTELKCRGYDGRVLRGQKAPEGNDGDAAYTLLDEVHSFQVLYGITNSAVTNDNSARPVQFVRADQLAAELAVNSQVVAIRIALLIKGEGNVEIAPLPQFKLLNEDAMNAPSNHLYKQFETTVTLRNVKNFMRNRKV
ncbi:PilW family protein [Aestuariibacter halophilus]|uniref:PilW family protein n=1 Tax=Fluctibacter halophilus TaxID=226011 RepID=A0ABS8G476_9ALTE|nr:PilW family protein [Aestuariibacter halophilus]MCC2614655.1 PilW family protein [Aestuariibacter halophilus]